jgi:hypothetical protein
MEKSPFIPLFKEGNGVAEKEGRVRGLFREQKQHSP